jgi:hypothetical protein
MRLVFARCIGHGGIPYAPFKEPFRPGIDWAETTLAGDPRETRRALNGFAVLRLNGATLTEELWDEQGNRRWIAPDPSATQ